MRLIFTLLLAISIALPIAACATSIDDRSISQLREESMFFVEGYADKVEGICEKEQCLTKYKINITRAFKTPNAKNTIDVCIRKPISLGQKYFFFIHARNVNFNETLFCEYFAFPDGILIESVDGSFYRYFSIDGTNRSVILNGRKFETYLIEEPGFSNFVSGHKDK